MDHPSNPFPEADGAAQFPPKFAKAGLTFDDVLLRPAESSVLPSEVDRRSTRLNSSHVQHSEAVVCLK